MTDEQVFAICAAAVAIAFLCVVALRIWVDHKEEMKALEDQE